MFGHIDKLRAKNTELRHTIKNMTIYFLTSSLYGGVGREEEIFYLFVLKYERKTRNSAL